jgi:ATP/maltotriose-dependent transcriptional regulator MalT
MELIERAGFLTTLQSLFNCVAKGEGHCIFVTGEAGIGKTSLVKEFCRESANDANIYLGTCDALFTPRPLAPLYDILLQMRNDLSHLNPETEDRTSFFTKFLHEINNQKGTTIMIFEDIHWADEATLDFIKFLARRITLVHCLFILTYRDNEIHTRHPLRTVLGQLNTGSFTRMQLPPFTKEAVEKLAKEKGYNGENVYSISGGNPFYVNEILAGYSAGVPDNIKDSILSVYNRLDENTKRIWELLSVMPTGFRLKELELMEPSFATSIENCLDTKILVINKDMIFFKHELYRRTVESSLSPLLRINLHKKILQLLLESFEANGKIEQIIHHAKNANDYDLVIKYAPDAARQAASVGAHVESAKLYLSAIEYYQGHETDLLIRIYEGYAYECYLTNQIKEAIIYSGRALTLWKKKNDVEKMGNAMRFLSRLWWFDGNRKEAESFAKQAIDVLQNQSSSSAKAMAYSNMSQLKMLSDEPAECILWGSKAIAMAKDLQDDEILSHALNNVGDVQIRITSTWSDGFQLLQQSLDIALKNSYHEHVARAYTNIAHNGILTRQYDVARENIDAGIRYCEERDLDSWTTYLLSSRARMMLDTGKWNEAEHLANDLLKDEYVSPLVKTIAFVIIGTIKSRKGEEAIPILQDAISIAMGTMELQRIIPALVAALEHEWITGNQFIAREMLDESIEMMKRMGNRYENTEFAYWINKSRRIQISIHESFEGFEMFDRVSANRAAQLWQKAGCPYLYALALYEGSDQDKKKAIAIIHDLGAQSVYEKLKMEMRSSGIKSIPRGMRKSTQSNPASLTDRELDVLQLLNQGLQNKEIAAALFISAKTVDHHISSILFKLEVNTRAKAVQQAVRLDIIK